MLNKCVVYFMSRGELTTLKETDSAVEFKRSANVLLAEIKEACVAEAEPTEEQLRAYCETLKSVAYLSFSRRLKELPEKHWSNASQTCCINMLYGSTVHCGMGKEKVAALAVAVQARMDNCQEAFYPERAAASAEPEPEYWGEKAKGEDRVGPDEWVYILHGGGREHVDSFLAGKGKGYRLEEGGVGIQVSPIRADSLSDGRLIRHLMSRTKVYAKKGATSYVDTGTVFCAKIQAKHLHAANNGYEGGLTSANVEHLQKLSPDECRVFFNPADSAAYAASDGFCVDLPFGGIAQRYCVLSHRDAVKALGDRLPEVQEVLITAIKECNEEMRPAYGGADICPLNESTWPKASAEHSEEEKTSALR